MKKRIIISAAALLIVLCLGYIPIKERIERQKKPDQADPNATFVYNPETIGEAMLLSPPTAVFLGTVEQNNETAKKMTVAVDEVIAGKCGFDKISVRYIRELQEGEQYLMFLDKWQSFAPSNEYVFSSYDACYKTEDGALEGITRRGDLWLSENNDTMEKMRDFLERIWLFCQEESSAKNEFDTVEEMYMAAVTVMKVKVTSLQKESETTDLVKTEVIKLYKGMSPDEGVGYRWPSAENLKEGGEYYVFLDRDGLPLNENAVTGKKKKKWREIHEFLNRYT